MIKYTRVQRVTQPLRSPHSNDEVINLLLKKNDIIKLEITDITGQGSGIAKLDGMAVFVPLTAPGDVIDAHILKVKKNYAFAKVEKLIVPSPMRIEPDCGCYAKCGGCVFRHITYEEELKIKQQRVYDALTRIGKLSGFTMHNIEGSESPNCYRNKSQIPIGRDKNGNVIMGFFGSHSHRIIDCRSCGLHPREFDDIAAAVRDWVSSSGISVYDESTGTGLLRHLYIRCAKETQQIMVCLVINGDSIPHKDTLTEALAACSDKITSIILNVNRDKTNVIMGKQCITIYGKGHITDKLCGLSFDISPLSFYQINHDQTEKLYGIAADYAHLTGKEFLIDLYCGTGTIGLSMAHKAERVLGIEIIPQAIENAKTNARTNGITNAEFICSDASAAAQRLSESGTLPDTVVIDPPRKGCDKTVIESICTMSPDRVVYVSCDPETLARDLALFKEKGYKTSDVTPVDMFPRTQHVETVALILKERTDNK